MNYLLCIQNRTWLSLKNLFLFFLIFKRIKKINKSTENTKGSGTFQQRHVFLCIQNIIWWHTLPVMMVVTRKYIFCYLNVSYVHILFYIDLSMSMFFFVCKTFLLRMVRPPWPTNFVRSIGLKIMLQNQQERQSREANKTY